ncbi:protein glutamate methylesterase CheB associated with MCPs of classes 40H and 40+24H, response receiver domain-containing [Geotalea daltonii FRC-32]|uniref:Protein-glutamate methylesterase/protein-glutamine glutaminase n=1 Tax=Geotalea daltonii (strain DSM 22248 / JCM 15807 / FRC-32) TaxID=316067 RepID=B9M7R3_GEODF|nr:chemotaxis response regulator protein-glutamate methylesterase [Geotalea daltonii]ACM22169.1 protein glutamate methylesterase CheB associated with MCPs of classes 40H and 40+24H, response receiver domain-containing [Geotalea daltonii FRC-32]
MTPMHQGRLKVLVVDDSCFMRMAIRGILAKDPQIEIVGIAADGIEGIEKAIELRPDIITMDVEMPRMDGIAALKQIMAKAPTRVLMVSTLTCEGAKATFEALEAGAIDYIPKNISDSSEAQKVFREELLNKVKQAGSSLVQFGTSVKRSIVPSPAAITKSRFSKRVNCVGIGASTGGPVALQEVLSRIPANFPFGIMVAIHMPKAFTGPYAERLNAKCSLEIHEAKDGDILRPGLVLIAPGGRHTSIIRQGAGLTVKTDPTTLFPQYLYIPSVDQMMHSLAEASNGSMLGVVLTGMGSDGFKGMQFLKTRGGVTLVQDEATSTIYGMPKACIDGGVADEVLPLEQIGFEIARIAG